MRPKRPKELAQLINLNTGALAKLQHGAQQITQINQAVRALLPELISKQVTVANYREGILILTVPSAGWAQRLRFAQSMLLSQLRKQHLPGLSTINVQIVPNKSIVPKRTQVTGQSRMISPSTAEQLRALADHAPAELKKQLLKLAKREK
ncbi:DUF721 domain-containing protein [Corallincola holothuriorum]|uniref:DUF721 domain-containing protein n=1 Tax=Corallincola holothuriorum TaxID=2282215 RepID=A0A368NH42_9GAMM|nr:DciA family protein [Corallincola holothuriorum]RCU49892.1 DUF721 domain-containing protein [Corallincola holothuriorum]